MPASAVDFAKLVGAAAKLRHALHRSPDPSNDEAGTAARVERFLREFGLRPFRRGIGGHGLLYRVRGRRRGPRRLFRADLDALPIVEQNRIPYRSRRSGAHHACGHDGHMAMLAASLVALHSRADFGGEVVGLFQPAEETGEGARRILDELGPRTGFNRVFAIHNCPGLPVGSVGIRRRVAARASAGLEIRLVGRRGHASEPDRAVNPLPILARLAIELQSIPTIADRFQGRTLATLIGWRSDGPNFGVSPASGSLFATLRGDRNVDLRRLQYGIRRRAQRLGAAYGISVGVRTHDPFPHTENHPTAAAEAIRAAQGVGLVVKPQRHPLSGSEDFGHFTARWPGALILLGAGEECPPLHSDRYDFPDALLRPGVNLWCQLAGAVPTKGEDRGAGFGR